MKLALQLVEALSVFLVIFYVYCRSPAFRPLKPDWPRPRGKIRLYLVFTGIAILGNYLGVWLPGGAVANTRAVGSTLGGLLGGPSLGVLVGITAGVQRLSFGGFSAFTGCSGLAFGCRGGRDLAIAFRSFPALFLGRSRSAECRPHRREEPGPE